MPKVLPLVVTAPGLSPNRCCLILFLLIGLNANAQKTLKDLFLEDSIVWYGIDYTETRFIGNFENLDLKVYYHGWNRLVMEEPAKYNIGKVLRKNSVIKDISYVEKINEKSSAKILYSDKDSTLQRNDIIGMISGYQSNTNDGLGLVLIAEKYNRLRNLATHYMVIFDISSKKVLLTQKFTTAPGGSGIRNLWAGAIYDVFKLMDRNYSKWKVKYGDVR